MGSLSLATFTIFLTTGFGSMDATSSRVCGMSLGDFKVQTQRVQKLAKCQLDSSFCSANGGSQSISGAVASELSSSVSKRVAASLAGTSRLRMELEALAPNALQPLQLLDQGVFPREYFLRILADPGMRSGPRAESLKEAAIEAAVSFREPGFVELIKRVDWGATKVSSSPCSSRARARGLKPNAQTLTSQTMASETLATQVDRQLFGLDSRCELQWDVLNPQVARTLALPVAALMEWSAESGALCGIIKRNHQRYFSSWKETCSSQEIRGVSASGIELKWNVGESSLRVSGPGIPTQVFRQGPGQSWSSAAAASAHTSAQTSASASSAQGLLALWPELKHSCEVGSSKLTPQRGPPSFLRPNSPESESDSKPGSR